MVVRHRGVWELCAAGASVDAVTTATWTVGERARGTVGSGYLVALEPSTMPRAPWGAALVACPCKHARGCEAGRGQRRLMAAASREEHNIQQVKIQTSCRDGWSGDGRYLNHAPFDDVSSLFIPCSACQEIKRPLFTQSYALYLPLIAAQLHGTVSR